MSENIFKFPGKENKLDNLPDPPEELGFEAKCVWLRAGKYLFENGLLNDGNLDLFHSYCVILGEARECESMVAVDGKIIGGKKHIAWQMGIDASKEAKNIYLALNPKGIRVKGEEEIDEENNWKKDKGLLA